MSVLSIPHQGKKVNFFRVCYYKYVTIFSKIITGEEPSYPVWEDDSFLAFLTPFPNTPGLTVVIPKENPGDYIFDISDDMYVEFLKATKTVARILEKALNVKRVALVFEGTGVAHVHAKLYPLYGKFADKTNMWSDHVEFTDTYRKYLTTVEGPLMSAEKLKEIQTKIVQAQKQGDLPT